MTRIETGRSGWVHRRRLLCGPTPATVLWGRRGVQPGWPDPLRSGFTFNARAALHVGSRLIGLQAGDSVLFPAYCCGAELDTLLNLNLRPVFYRVEPDLAPDLNHLGDLARRPGVRALFVIHYFGRPQTMDALRELARRSDLLLIEDCAHALFALDGEGRPVGDQADLAIFSLRKHLPVPNGGVLVTANRFTDGPMRPRQPLPVRRSIRSWAALASVEIEKRWPVSTDRLRSRLGIPPRFDLDDGAASTFPQGSRFDPRFVRWRPARWTRGMIKLADAARIRARRLDNYRRLSSVLAGTLAVRPLWEQAPAGASPSIMPVRTDAPLDLCRFLARHQVEAYPLWRSVHPAIPRGAGNEADLRKQLVALPVQHGLGVDEMERIGEVIANWQVATARARC